LPLDQSALQASCSAEERTYIGLARCVLPPSPLRPQSDLCSPLQLQHPHHLFQPCRPVGGHHMLLSPPLPFRGCLFLVSYVICESGCTRHLAPPDASPMTVRTTDPAPPTIEQSQPSETVALDTQAQQTQSVVSLGKVATVLDRADANGDDASPNANVLELMTRSDSIYACNKTITEFVKSDNCRSKKDRY
jgi:hypothetical protein